MQSKYQNIYKAARAGAGLTQEQAAEMLDLSVESIKAYETGLRTPPDATVRLMAREYDEPGLVLEHAAETDELGLIPEGASPQPFPLSVIQFVNHLMDFAERHRGQQLLQIAADGVVDADERPLLDEIVCELEGISAALLALKCGASETKKERPEAGTSKRSSSRRPRTTATNIIPQSHGKSSAAFAGKAVSVQ